MSGRVLTLLRRSLAAARLGFPFWGTTRSGFPRHVRLAGRRVELAAPEDSGYLNDVINVWLDDEYGLKALAAQPKTVVDLGANIGIFSLWAAHCFPQAAIHAYEPNPRIIDYTRRNLRDTAVRVFEEGVGAAAGRASMVDHRESRMASTRISDAGEIAITPLAEVVERIGGRVDLMKIDCEGAEWDILKDRVSLAKVANVRMEYHLVGGATFADFEERVAALGYRLDALARNQGFGIAWLSRAA